jgi:alkylhydroperoxidase/carboxymuconolactone decarboxylase family protein YurZ
MTKEEIEETMAVWKTMDGNASFIDALNKIGNRKNDI